MAPRDTQGDVNDKSGNAAKDVHYQSGTPQNSSAAVYSSTPASASSTSTSFQVPVYSSTPASASSTSFQVPALCPVARLSNHPNNNTNQLFPRAAIAKPAKPWTHFFMKGGMAMEDRRISRITSTTHPQTHLRFGLRHPHPNPNPRPTPFLMSATELIRRRRPMAMEWLREIVRTQTTKHRSHECVEEGVDKNVIPAARNFESSSSPGVLHRQVLPPSPTKKNRTAWSFDLNLPAPEQEDNEDERTPSLTLSLLV